MYLHAKRTLFRERTSYTRDSPSDATALLLNYSRERFTSLADGKGGGALFTTLLCSRLLDKANVKLVIQNNSQDLYNTFMNCSINFNSVFIEKNLDKILFFKLKFLSFKFNLIIY